MSDWVNIWEILGIEHTSDISAIKRAYAERAKECHPEEHPEEFRKLQKAYKAALKFTKNRAVSGQQTPGEEPPISQPGETPGETDWKVIKEAWPESRETESKLDESLRFEPEENGSEAAEDVVADDLGKYDFSEIQEEQERQKEEALANFRKKLMRMIWNPYARNNVEIWKSFLLRENMDALFQKLEYRIEFVHLMYEERFAGWHQKQISFFDRYLTKFQISGIPPVELQTEEWDWLHRFAETDRSLLTSPGTSEERQNYYSISTQNKDLRIGIHVKPGQFWEEGYLAWYLDYAEKNEDRLKDLYRDWVARRKHQFEYGSQEQDFWKKFLYIIWNPYVRNDRKTWEYFFGMEGIRELFEMPEFRTEFVQRICQMRYGGWNIRQIAFFRQYLENCATASGSIKELNLEEWLWLTKGTGLSLLISSKEVSDYRDVCKHDLLKGDNSAERYLTWYWDYAHQNEDSLFSRYKHWESVRKERLYEHKPRILGALIFIAVMILVLSFVSSYMREKERENRQQQLYEEMLQEWYEELNVHGGT